MSMYLPSHMKYGMALLLAFMLHGCSRESQSASAEAVKSASTPVALASAALQNIAKARKEDEFTPLMAAIFGSDYKVDQGVAVAELTNPSDRSEQASFVITPVARARLKTGETVLVANAEFADSDGQSMSTHASPGLLNVFFLAQSQERWVTLSRHENIAELGSHGGFGKFEWVQLGPDKPGFAIEHGWSGQGYMISLVALFEIRNLTVHALTPNSIKIYSDNLGACEEDTPECWGISATWRLSPEPDQPYSSLHLVFSGEETKLPSDQDDSKKSSQKRLVTKLRSAAKYQFDGKQYELVEGENIVREF